MKRYSGHTRVELTALGWLYVAKDKLKQKLATEDKVRQSKLEREVAIAIRSASEMLGTPRDSD